MCWEHSKYNGFQTISLFLKVPIFCVYGMTFGVICGAFGYAGSDFGDFGWSLDRVVFQ